MKRPAVYGAGRKDGRDGRDGPGWTGWTGMDGDGRGWTAVDRGGRRWTGVDSRRGGLLDELALVGALVSAG
ncbi:MAG TPA: hypothetical protein VGL72_14330 [Bryobacteraceae bacterium]